MEKNPQENKLIRTPNGGLIQDVVRYIKLIWLLMTDRRINIFLKILPVASLAYLLSPIDLAPGLALPVIGALDDAAIVWIGTSLFISLCPETIVAEHTRTLEKVIPGIWREPNEIDEMVDAEARDITDAPTKE